MENEITYASSIRKPDGIEVVIPRHWSHPPPRTPSPSSWVGREAPIPIPSSFRGDFQSDSQRSSTGAPSSWRTFQGPSSWGGASLLFNDEASVYGDDQSDRGTEASSGSGLTYAQKRRLLRRMSKSSIISATPRQKLHIAKEKWTKKLEDFREYEVGIWKSLLPLKAGVGASLAACLCFAPFVPELLTYYGTVAVLGVGMSLESNVGLTLQKGYNLMLGSALAGACALIVSLVEPYTGSYRVYYLVFCVFLGGFFPRLISLPKIIKTRWAQTLTYYISVFHGLVLNKSIRMEYTGQFFLNCICYSAGFLIVLILTLCVKPYYAGDTLLSLLVSDFHTAGVVLERIVDDYGGGEKLTKIQDLLSGVVKEDHIHHDLQYIMKSTAEVEKLMDAVKWEPSHGKFFRGYPWDLYPTLLDMLLNVMYDLISLDSALRAEIQAPLHVRQLFAEDMLKVARECSMLFHKVGDALQEHTKINYHGNVDAARAATANLRMRLTRLSSKVISDDNRQLPFSAQISRIMSCNSVQEDCEEGILASAAGTPPTPPASPLDVDSSEGEQVLEAPHRSTIAEHDWQARLFLRRQSVGENWEKTQQQMCSLSFIKFTTILIELMSKVKTVVTMVDRIAAEARFSDVSS